MPRPKSAIPPYRHHKSTGRAVVYVNRKSVFLGKYDSPESRQKYAEIISQITSGDLTAGMSSGMSTAEKPAKRSVSSLCLRFVAEKLPGYADAEQACFRGAMRILVGLFGETATDEFGPIRLRAVRAAMVEGDPNATGPDGQPKPRKRWSRSFVNKEIKRLKHLFKWGVSWELVPASIAAALATVESLAPGETDAAESTPRRAIPVDHIDAVRAVLNDLQRDIVDLLMMTGARPGEIIGLTTGQIERSGEVWQVELRRHKTAHKGKERHLFFNARAQEIILRYIKADPDARLFPIRRDTFGAAVKNACIKAGVPVWTPHWLRHTVATKLADEMGTESAQRLLGHATRAMTEHYSKAAKRQAIDAAKRLG